MNWTNRSIYFPLAAVACLASGCTPATTADPTAEVSTLDTNSLDNAEGAVDDDPPQKRPEDEGMNLETITLGAGCFWCIEAVLDRIKGVTSVESGYMGGNVENPTYRDVCSGTTNHAEVVQVKFDKTKLPLAKLLDIFWQLHDPTTLNRQGYDEGTQYRSAIFFHTDEQRETAEESKKKWDASGKFTDPIVTEITPAAVFYIAEDDHQDFFARNPRNPYCQANVIPKFRKLGLLKDSDGY